MVAVMRWYKEGRDGRWNKGVVCVCVWEGGVRVREKSVYRQFRVTRDTNRFLWGFLTLGYDGSVQRFWLRLAVVSCEGARTGRCVSQRGRWYAMNNRSRKNKERLP